LRSVPRRINATLHDIERNPFKGIGKPEPLRGDLAGWWSRRITGDHRIIYRALSGDRDCRIEIAACRYHYSQGCPGNKRRLRNWSQTQPGLVMAVLDTAIYAFRPRTGLVDGRIKSGHDSFKFYWKPKITVTIVQQFPRTALHYSRRR
jgi:toxin YoeB